MLQTEIQNPSAIRLGSVKLEIGASLDSLVNVGALRGVSLKEKGKSEEILFDNAERIKRFTDADLYSVSAKLCEIDWDNIQIMNDGQVVVTNNAGTLTTITAEAHGTGWTIGSPIKAAKKNHDNSIVGSIVVKSGSTILTAGTDYRTYVADGSNGVSGYTYVVPLTAQSGAITLGYTYTPAASKSITFNQSGTKTGKYMRITNVNSAGMSQVITLSGVSNIAPIEIAFASDNEATVAELPIELEGRVVEILDEQAA